MTGMSFSVYVLHGTHNCERKIKFQNMCIGWFSGIMTVLVILQFTQAGIVKMLLDLEAEGRNNTTMGDSIA